jgi:central kinetochore subunit Mal2/MCM21
VRSLRREIAHYHNRVTAISGLRDAFGLTEKKVKSNGKGKGKELVIVDISAADAEAKHVRLEWADGRIGRIVVDDRGVVLKCVVTSGEGRDRLIERKVLGGNRRLEELVDKLR